MRFLGLVVAGLLVLTSCSSSDSLEIVVGQGGEGESSPPDAPTAAPPGDELCQAWLDLRAVEVVAQRSWSSGMFGAVDASVLDAWVEQHLYPALATLAEVLPPAYDEPRRAIVLLLELDTHDPTRQDQELQRELLLQHGMDLDRITSQMEQLAVESDERCGVVEDLELVDLRRGDLPAHLARVAREIRLGSADAACVSGSEAVVLVEQWLTSAPADPVGEISARCGLDPIHAAMFVWRVGDMRPSLGAWEELGVVTEPPTLDAPPPEYLGPPEPEPPVIELPDISPGPVQPSPVATPEVYGYPIEGLVLDVLGTLGIVDDAGRCLIDGGIYEPTQLWFDEPGVNPEVLDQQRAVLDELAQACGFTTVDVDQWLTLGGQYLAEVEG